MTTLKTTLTRYRFDIDEADQREAYKALREKLEADGRHWFNAIADPSNARKRCPEGEVELETDCLFDNQWNTVGVGDHSGYRIFDWYEGIFPNKRIKEGHYLEITYEMREIRRNTLKCGYCGHQEPAAKGNVFCPACLDSEYLKEDELHLTRLVPIERICRYVGEPWLMRECVIPEQEYDDKGNRLNVVRPPLTDAEKAYLLPLFIERQTTGSDSRNANKLRKQRADIERTYAKAIEDANAERDGFLWLMDHNLAISNVIYYTHTSKFGFGWRNPVSASVVSKLLEIISEFPFPYEIKGICPIEGTKRTWEGY